MNKANIISLILKYIGICVILIGVVISIIIGDKDNITTTIVLIISSTISGFVLLGFSEVINLLQQSVDNQTRMIIEIKKNSRTKVSNNSDN